MHLRHATEPNRLMAAILEDAARVYARARGRRTQLVLETERWLLSRDVKHPFSFLRVCAALELHPDGTRRWLRMGFAGTQPPPDLLRSIEA